MDGRQAKGGPAPNDGNDGPLAAHSHDKPNTDGAARVSSEDILCSADDGTIATPNGGGGPDAYARVGCRPAAELSSLRTTRAPTGNGNRFSNRWCRYQGLAKIIQKSEQILFLS